MREEVAELRDKLSRKEAGLNAGGAQPRKRGGSQPSDVAQPGAARRAAKKQRVARTPLYIDFKALPRADSFNPP